MYRFKAIAAATVGVISLGILAVAALYLLVAIRSHLGSFASASTGALLLTLVAWLTVALVLSVCSFALGILWRRFFGAMHIAVPLALAAIPPALALVVPSVPLAGGLLLAGLLVLYCFFCAGATRGIRHGIAVFGIALIFGSAAAILLVG